ncbi:phage tail tape measure protein [Fuchsiella alkaliacetigena]|uniref:phage tail tape measure protein n=1 Tax=Fuchsiella alkaliacetigena TaxID=957042 RepID=UPI002009EA64|nr:phage tail tape measure protein [Fuchsiella alkaliacetigena]MCK8824736.1 phage tail tape measure protein [Fuchsiella alkaliacetigena]
MTRQEVVSLMIRAQKDLQGIDATVQSLQGMRRELERVARGVRSQSRKIIRNIERMKRGWERLRNTMKTIRNAALGFFTLIVAKASIPIKFYADLQKELSNVNTLLNVSQEELREYEQAIISLSNQTGKSATELTQGLYDVVSAGVDAANSMGVLEQAAKAAQAGMTEVDTAAKAGISTINAYGMSIDELNDVYDIQFSTIRSGIITYEELGNNIGKLIPSAAALDEELSNVYGSLGFITQQGQNADQATTSLARAFDELAARSEEIRSVTGIEVFDDLGEFRGLPEVMEELAEHMEDMSREEVIGNLEEIGFGEQASRAIRPMIRNYEQFEEIIDDVADSSGAMEEAHEKAIDNIAHDFNRLRQTAINVLRQIGSAFEGESRDIITTLREWLETTGEVIEENREAIKIVAEFALGLAKTAAIIAAVATAFLALTTPLGLLITGVAALYAAWRLNLFGVREITEEVIEDIKKIWDDLRSIEAVKFLIEFAGDTWKALKDGDLQTVLGRIVTLKVSLALMKGAAAAIKAKIISGLGLGLGTAALGAGKVGLGTSMLGVLSVGIALKEALGDEGDFESFGADLIAALAAGIGVSFIGGPKAGTLAFTVFMNFQIGSWIAEELDEKLSEIGPKADSWFTRFQPSGGSSSVHNPLPGLKSGGYTGNIPVDEVAGVVHGGEWVAPAWMVDDPEFGSIIAQLEQARRGYKDGGHVGRNLSTLQESGLADDSMLYGMLENLSKIAEDTEEFQKLVEVIASVDQIQNSFENELQDVKSQIEEDTGEVEEFLENIESNQQEQSRLLEKTNSVLAENLTEILGQDGDYGDLQNMLAQDLYGAATENITNQFADAFEAHFQTEFAGILTDIEEIDFSDDPEEAFEQAQQALEEFEDQLEEAGYELEGSTSSLERFADTLEATLNDLSGVISDLNNLGMESDTLDNLDSLINSMQSGMSLMDSLSGTLGNLASGLDNIGASSLSSGASSLASLAGGPAGMIAGAGIGIGSELISSSRQRQQEQIEAFEEGLAESKEQTELLEEIKGNTLETARNIVSLVAGHPTQHYIGQGEEHLQNYLGMMQTDILPDFSELEVLGARNRRTPGRSDEDMSETLDLFTALRYMGHDVSGFLERAGGSWGPDYDDLKEMNDLIQGLDESDFDEDVIEDIFGESRIRDDVDTNLEEIQDQIQYYLDTIGELKKQIDNFSESVRYEDFGMTEWQSAQDQVENYREQIEQMYEESGKDLDDHMPEIDEAVEEYADKFVDGGERIITVMQDVRGSFINTFADGGSLIESFAGGLSSAFGTMFEDISRLMYDTLLNDLDQGFNELFGSVADELVEYDLSEDGNLMDFSEDLIESSDLDGLFDEMAELEDKQENMTTIVDVIRQQARDAGISEEMIDQMLPMTEAEERAREIANTVSNELGSAMRDALDTGDYLDFTQSMGESIYQNAKDGLIDAFVESETYQKLFEDWFDFGNVDSLLDGVEDPRQAFKVIESELDVVMEDLKEAGLDFGYDRVPGESGREEYAGGDYYAGADTSGEKAKIVNQHFYFNPSIGHLYGPSQTELFEKWEDWQEEQEKTQI